MNILSIDDLVMASKGNPGAAVAMAEMVKAGHELTVATIMMLGIEGTDIYVLWSDICGKDCTKLKNLVDRCPGPLLVDAASRQDYSGRQIVAKYL